MRREFEIRSKIDGFIVEVFFLLCFFLGLKLYVYFLCDFRVYYIDRIGGIEGELCGVNCFNNC